MIHVMLMALHDNSFEAEGKNTSQCLNLQASESMQIEFQKEIIYFKLNLLKWYYDENRIFPIEAIL